MLVLSCLAVAAEQGAAILRIHYYRTQGDYSDWGIHVWGESVNLPRRVTWASPLPPTGVDDGGIFFEIPLQSLNGDVNFILHHGDVRNSPVTVRVNPAANGLDIWQLQDDAHLYTQRPASVVAQSAPAVGEHTTAPSRELEEVAQEIQRNLRNESAERAKVESALKSEYEAKLRVAAEQQYQEAVKRLHAEADARARMDNSLPVPSASAAANALHPPATSWPDTRSSELQAPPWWVPILVFVALGMSGAMIWQQRRNMQMAAALNNALAGKQKTEAQLDDSRLEQQSLRQKMAAMEQRLTTVFTHAADLMAIFSVELGDCYRMIAVNQAFCSQTGHGESSIIGRRSEEVFMQEPARTEILLRLKETVRRGQPVTFEQRVEFPAGLLILESTLTPIFAQAGFCSHLLLASRPKSDLRQTQQPSQSRVQRTANFDVLTGLPNRSLFQQKLNFAVNRIQRQRSPFCLLIINLQSFRSINDRFGFEGGDLYLQTIGQRLNGCVRDSDTVARLGGDEFAILLNEDSDAAAAASVAEKVASAVQRPVIINGEAAKLSVNIGISIFPDDARDANALMHHANTAMRRAKETRDGSYQYYSPQMDQHALEKAALENSLRRAVLHRELHWLFQPIIDLETGHPVGVEALLRWQHPEFGQVMPHQFLPVAETIGLMPSLLEWGLQQLVIDFVPLLTRHPGWRCSVNLSSSQFHDPQLLTTIDLATGPGRIPPQRLTLEITESALLANPALSETVLDGLRNREIRVAIDNFGAGYSSLTAIRRYAIDEIKIDRSFVSGIPGDSNEMAMIQSVVQQARNLELCVVAKGVESEAQQTFLKNCGCDRAQGFLIAVPMPMEELRTRYIPSPVILRRIGA